MVDNDFDLVVGVPRSGILPGTMLALLLHKPFSTLNEFLHDLNPLGGERISHSTIEYKKILIVDDSIYGGTAMNSAREKLNRIQNNYEFKFLAIYTTEESKEMVDFFFEVVNPPRIFEWNLLRSWIYSKSCVDIDGVLCEDPTDEENDDGPKYKEFLLNAKPKIIPETKVKLLVTNRLEKYRPETEIWLRSHGVEFQELIMCPFATKEERQRRNEYSKFKANVYLKLRYSSYLFIESSVKQAREINQYTKLPVFCVENMELFDKYPGLDIFRHRVLNVSNRIKKFIFE